LQYQKGLKIINDPIYGFITVPDQLIARIIDHPYFQRLRRITQMGCAHVVFPGARHSRFEHALGCLHLMQKAIRVLRLKGITISDHEKQALQIGILLHDIGHGPYSHTLESALIKSASHEELGLKFLESLNKEFDGELDLAIRLFSGNYHRKFLNQLIASQLDIDRLDYLKRDSFYAGVAEGNINSERIISMFNVHDDELVVDAKGIYSVENFLIARRLMYWQAYMHKTCVSAEIMLRHVLDRASELVNETPSIASGNLKKFLRSESDQQTDDELLKNFAELDDVDIIYHIKKWSENDDPVLSQLSQGFMKRNLLKIVISNEKAARSKISELEDRLVNKLGIAKHDVGYFISQGKLTNIAYKSDVQPIKIRFKDGNLKEVAEASDQLNLKALTHPVDKYYYCYPKVIN
jgi:HD superfamily phosphohydrolase